VPPGVNENIFFHYSQKQDRDSNLSTQVHDLLFTREDPQIFGHLDHPNKRPIFVVDTITSINNLTGLAECFGQSQALQERCNLIFLSSKRHLHEAINRDEAEEIQKL
ncbi:sucrose synthase, partial [Nostoc sp. HG1]|nr:sucrose synthase [Nostoc sp. HG1]